PSDLYDVENWGKQIDINDEKKLTEPIINGYISWSLTAYKIRGYKDLDLWELFVYHYKASLLSETCEIIFVPMKSLYSIKPLVSVAGELAKVTAEESPHQWTNEEIQEQLKRSSETFNSNYYNIPVKINRTLIMLVLTVNK
ncbi:hypothetical protein GcC1_201022, partial [Golovinomyces cichoracearum]